MAVPEGVTVTDFCCTGGGGGEGEDGGGGGAGPPEGGDGVDNRILGAITQATQVHDHGQTDSLGTRVFYYELRPPNDLKGLWLTTDRDPERLSIT